MHWNSYRVWSVAAQERQGVALDWWPHICNILFTALPSYVQSFEGEKKTGVIWWMNSYHFTWKAGPWLAEMCHTLRKPFRRPIRAHLSPPQWAVMACIVISLIAQSRVPPTGQPVRVVYKWAAVGSWRSIFRLSGGFCQLPFSFCFRSSMRWVRVSRARFSRSWGKIRYVHYNNRPPFLRHRTHTHTHGVI